ncbi:hypothetical protein PENSPDRAFT_249027 [Peniophora sp. CONT]|nr:hypothetical protein PENSPDRAFT_249027 [Peniophora sp. CONT]
MLLSLGVWTTPSSRAYMWRGLNHRSVVHSLLARRSSIDFPTLDLHPHHKVLRRLLLMYNNRASSSSMKRKGSTDSQEPPAKKARSDGQKQPTSTRTAAQATAGPSNFTPSLRAREVPKERVRATSRTDLCDVLPGHRHRDMAWVTEVNMNPTHYERYFTQTYDVRGDRTDKFATVILELPYGYASEVFPLVIPKDRKLRDTAMDPLHMARKSLRLVCDEYLEDAQEQELQPYLNGLDGAYEKQDGSRFQTYWALVTRMLRGFKNPPTTKLSSDLLEDTRLGLCGDASQIQNHLVIEACRGYPATLQPQPGYSVNEPIEDVLEEINDKGAARVRCLGRGAMYVAMALAIRANRRCDIAIMVEPDHVTDALRAWAKVEELARAWNLVLCGSLRIKCMHNGLDGVRACLDTADAIFWNPTDDTGVRLARRLAPAYDKKFIGFVDPAKLADVHGQKARRPSNGSSDPRMH